jgi:hypothetical protein
MTILRFEGYSDNTFGCTHAKDEYERINYDYNNCNSGELIEFVNSGPIEYLVQDPATGLGVVVTGQYCAGPSATGWMIGVANYQTENYDTDMPDWPMRFSQRGYRNSLTIEAPEDVIVRCLTRDGDDAD